MRVMLRLIIMIMLMLMLMLMLVFMFTLRYINKVVTKQSGARKRREKCITGSSHL